MAQTWLDCFYSESLITGAEMVLDQLLGNKMSLSLSHCFLRCYYLRFAGDTTEKPAEKISHSDSEKEEGKKFTSFFFFNTCRKCVSSARVYFSLFQQINVAVAPGAVKSFTKPGGGDEHVALFNPDTLPVSCEQSGSNSADQSSGKRK